MSGLLQIFSIKTIFWGNFLGDPVVESLPSNAGDSDSIPGQRTKIPLGFMEPQKKKKES